MKKQISYLLMVMFAIPLMASAHPGRTDASGCHTCRTNCASWGLSTGEYHCHQSKGITQPIAPIHSIRNTAGVGSTIPAPEYATPKQKSLITNIYTAEVAKAIPSPIVVKKSPWYLRIFGF